MLRTVHFMEASVVDILFVIAMLASSETQGQIKGARESLNGWKNIYGTKKSKQRREENPGDNVLPDQFQTVAAVLASDWCQKNTSFQVSVLYFSSCHIFSPV